MIHKRCEALTAIIEKRNQILISEVRKVSAEQYHSLRQYRRTFKVAICDVKHIDKAIHDFPSDTDILLKIRPHLPKVLGNAKPPIDEASCARLPRGLFLDTKLPSTLRQIDNIGKIVDNRGIDLSRSVVSPRTDVAFIRSNIPICVQVKAVLVPP